uniref:Uncharacterized protein n=1 Tax=Onchocerca volvulus TaxID=6282 RepID=A0A044U8T2_ONCVO
MTAISSKTIFVLLCSIQQISKFPDKFPKLQTNLIRSMIYGKEEIGSYRITIATALITKIITLSHCTVPYGLTYFRFYSSIYSNSFEVSVLKIAFVWADCNQCLRSVSSESANDYWYKLHR